MAKTAPRGRFFCLQGEAETVKRSSDWPGPCSYIAVRTSIWMQEIGQRRDAVAKPDHGPRPKDVHKATAPAKPAMITRSRTARRRDY
jgi:hypothetical protein